MNQIKIGTIVQANEKAASYIEQIIPYGFECFTFTYGGGKFNGFEPEKLADAVMPILREKQIEVSNISVFGNHAGTYGRSGTHAAVFQTRD